MDLCGRIVTRIFHKMGIVTRIFYKMDLRGRIVTRIFHKMDPRDRIVTRTFHKMDLRSKTVSSSFHNSKEPNACSVPSLTVSYRQYIHIRKIPQLNMCGKKNQLTRGKCQAIQSQTHSPWHELMSGCGTIVLQFTMMNPRFFNVLLNHINP